ncbi:hypothetical protein EKO27_g10610 [Xylaria grammica]|uniref:Uncharacterized protein n=1 Tax=Xylaria grammica TaxID=363999 RepID=A0A439CQQ4_9PEZI|nr:hypothetical protein EKO27_g10610 [Xylaria grammica]
MQPSSNKRKTAEQMAPREKTAPSSPSAHISSELIVPSTGSSDSPKTTTNQHHGDAADAPVESIPLGELETAPHMSEAHRLLAKTEGERMPSEGALEARYESFFLTNIHDRLCGYISGLAVNLFEPTPWDKLKLDDQSKLNRWTPDARLLIESKTGYRFIFQAWIWHILDDEVFLADPKTKWQNQDDGFEAVKLLSQFIDCILISAELALNKSPTRQSIDPDYVIKRINSNLGYLMKSSPMGDYDLKAIGSMTAEYDTAMLICQVKPMLVWTDPLKQDEQTALYGFPFITKNDPERERLGTHNAFGVWQESRMVAKKGLSNTDDLEVLQATSEGKPVQLVINPGVVTRGCIVTVNHKSKASDWHVIYWRYYMGVLVPGSFNPPIKPAIIMGGKFLPAA